MFYRDKNFSKILFVLIFQAILGLGFSTLCFIISNELRSLLSSLLGFALVFIPTLVYIKVAFSRGLVVLPDVAIKLHKKAIIYRLGITTILFILVFACYKNCNFFIFFVTYLVTLSGYWFSLLKW